MEEYLIDNLNVSVYSNRNEMGINAANEIIEKLKTLLNEKVEVRMIFAAAPSQDDMTEELIKHDEVEWNRVIAFHMDEYIGLEKDAPQKFGNYLKKKVFDHLPFKEVHYIDQPNLSPERICEQYELKLKEKNIDIICMGIGENGHIAFNDPPVAVFKDNKLVKIVELDNICRQQQVNDGCFNTLDQVPTRAITLTVPVFMNADNLFCVVPNERKAEAVKATLEMQISEKCPSTILRSHKSAKLYLDQNSAKLLHNK
ncbi:MAG: glucosamine-6-phosphate deaminase [Ignavibacteriales bacterium]|nr:glucosamine-6-phosphate deaminase [Ignavibacteriales bacterium]